jgi:hypothetical protein
MYRYLILPLVLSVGFLSSCETVTAQGGKSRVIDVDADDELGGTGPESGDFRSCAERIARGITGIRWPREGEQPRIALIPFTNHTRFRVDVKLLQNKAMHDIVSFVRGKALLLARDSEEQVMAEREKKRSGHFDSGKKSKAMFGADYLLKGEMRALSKSSRDGVSDYIQYNFELIDAETTAILWVGECTTKKVGSIGVIFQ